MDKKDSPETSQRSKMGIYFKNCKKFPNFTLIELKENRELKEISLFNQKG